MTFIDWARKRAFVEPADGGGVAKWTGGSLAGLSYALTRAMREVLLGADPSVSLTRRAEVCLAAWREEEAPDVVHAGGTLVARQGSDVRWWTWAGYGANATLAATLPSIADPVQRPTDCYVRLREDLTPAMWRASHDAADGGAALVLPDLDRRAVLGSNSPQRYPSDSQWRPSPPGSPTSTERVRLLQRPCGSTTAPNDDDRRLAHMGMRNCPVALNAPGSVCSGVLPVRLTGLLHRERGLNSTSVSRRWQARMSLLGACPSCERAHPRDQRLEPTTPSVGLAETNRRTARRTTRKSADRMLRSWSQAHR
ncbi:hypothetical protein Srufu_019290 [Streptomyces libani subsp. rufus]|nr:hypothetical protein Srufu_019290 [Streptomyces libani subsp. rufus]